MTVREMIEKLSKLNPDATVTVVEGIEGEEVAVTTVEEGAGEFYIDSESVHVTGDTVVVTY